MCSSDLRALISHRLAHELYTLGLPLLARVVAELAHAETGIDIHPGATIGRGCFIDHGTGVVVGETAILGERVRIYELSRLYLTLGMLSEGGITILNAIDTVQGMVSANVKQGLQGARAMIEAGLPLSSAFEANGLTTPISLRMLRVGERAGNLGAMLMKSAEFHDSETSRWLEPHAV